MKNALIALGALVILPASVATAQEVQFGIINDSNADGTYSYEEISRHYPGATRAAVEAADRDGDGFVNARELLRAVSSRAFVG